MLGDILREEREKQNLTVKDVERDTSIRSLYISSIEKGAYDILPGEVYLKGFIKSYAEYLKLDGAAMLQQYYAEKSPEPVQAAAANEQQPAVDRQFMPVKAASNYLKNDFRERVKKSRQTQKLVAGVAVAGVLLAGMYWIFGSKDVPPAVNNAPAATNTARTGNEEKSAAATEKAYTGVEVTAKFSGDCWTEILTDDKMVFSGTVKAGESLSWKATTRLVITAGNAGAVELTYNGKSLGKLGQTGEVVTKKFTQDKAESAK